MARVLQQLTDPPRPCPYLPDRAASLEHSLMLGVSPTELEALLVRGYRRFGPDYFRPACAPCSACEPTRIPTATFTPSKSQRRAIRACAGLTVKVGAPRIDDARLELYHRWHAWRETSRAWEPSPLDEDGYFTAFAFPHPAARELAYYETVDDELRLVGVGICDETPRAWSAVYFYYDPGWAPRSLGVANVVFQVERARQRGLPYLYLGYYVEGCPSMGYKARFSPRERLLGWPDPGIEPVWVPVEDA